MVREDKQRVRFSFSFFCFVFGKPRMFIQDGKCNIIIYYLDTASAVTDMFFSEADTGIRPAVDYIQGRSGHQLF